MDQENTGDTNTSPRGDDSIDNSNDSENREAISPEAASAREADAAQRSHVDAAWRPEDKMTGENIEDSGVGETDAGVGSAQGGS